MSACLKGGVQLHCCVHGCTVRLNKLDLRMTVTLKMTMRMENEAHRLARDAESGFATPLSTQDEQT